MYDFVCMNVYQLENTLGSHGVDALELFYVCQELSKYSVVPGVHYGSKCLE